ncbi:hypothetical protein, partial [Bartonella grahamii]|uniref:hypothetical protein n=1 Tax=Bartonella grahamii TaxID=33045 RepID=UPI001ABADCE7
MPLPFPIASLSPLIFQENPACVYPSLFQPQRSPSLTSTPLHPLKTTPSHLPATMPPHSSNTNASSSSVLIHCTSSCLTRMIS